MEKAWNDLAQGAMYVHDSVTVHGGNSPATIRANDFMLTMTLAGGARKQYPAMRSAAPSYQKYSALTGQYTTAYQIEPKTDLGALGSIIVPAHTDVDVTVTFVVPDQIADASANRQVSFK